MVAAVTGGIGLASGMMGMIGGLRAAKATASNPAPYWYQIAGQEEQAAYRTEAGLLSRQSVMAYEQSLQEAAQTRREGVKFREQQALDFASSGITLAGSPLGVLEETRQLYQQEASMIERRGAEQSELLSMQGLQMLRRGSAAAFGGFAQGLMSQFTSQNQARQQRTQAYQAGLAGLSAGVQGIGSLFKK